MALGMMRVISGRLRMIDRAATFIARQRLPARQCHQRQSARDARQHAAASPLITTIPFHYYPYMSQLLFTHHFISHDDSLTPEVDDASLKTLLAPPCANLYFHLNSPAQPIPAASRHGLCHARLLRGHEESILAYYRRGESFENTPITAYSARATPYYISF